MTTNKDVYPVTADLEEKFEADTTFKDHSELVEAAIEYLGEYEHGSVDIEDVFREVPLHHRDYMLRAASAVLFDFVGTVVFRREQ